MSSTFRWIVVAAALAAAVGCGTLSIPRIAVQGTTITIPIPDGFGPGFGRVLNPLLPVGVIANPGTLSPTYSPTSALEDPQRGELLFALRNSTSAISSLVSYLPVRYVTRVKVDEGSPAAMPSPGVAFIGTEPGAGQVLALVDVPQQVTPGNYYIFVERWWRSATPPHSFVKRANPINQPSVDWSAWGGKDPIYGVPHPDLGMPVRVVASPYTTSRFSDALEGYDRWFGTYSMREFTQDLANLVPRPKLKIWVKNPDPASYQIPAAWEVSLSYPRKKIEIVGVELGSLDRSGAYVSVSPATGLEDSCSNKTGETKVSVVDPDRRSAWVEVVYRLRDFGVCGRAVAGDFAFAGTFKAYQADGAAIAAPYAWIDDSYSFQ